MSLSYGQEKELRVTFVLTTGGASFPGTGSNTLILTGLRMSAAIHSNVGYATQAELRIYGMRQADMNALTVVRWNPPALQTNVVTVEANGGSGWAQIFTGTITECSPEYDEIPFAHLHVIAQIGYANGLAIGPVLSYPNGATVESAVQSIASTMGFKFKNNGVTATIPKGAYFPGTPTAQLQAVTQSSQTDVYFDSDQTIAICPRGKARTDAMQVVLSPSSGLVAYPSVDVFGVVLTALFNPAFILGGPLAVKDTEIPAANGQWYIFSADHMLESVTFGGDWFSTLQCSTLAT